MFLPLKNAFSNLEHHPLFHSLTEFFNAEEVLEKTTIFIAPPNPEELNAVDFTAHYNCLKIMIWTPPTGTHGQPVFIEGRQEEFAGKFYELNFEFNQRINLEDVSVDLTNDLIVIDVRMNEEGQVNSVLKQHSNHSGHALFHNFPDLSIIN